MNASEFASQIKTKYPVYKNIPDQELVTKIITKYPQYKDKIDMGGNIENSVMGGLKKSGLLDIPVVGGLIGGAVRPTTQMADQAVGEQGAMSGPLFGLNMPTGTKTIAKEGVSGLEKTLPPQVGTAGTALAISDLPGIIKGGVDTVKNIGQGAKMLTKKGALAAQQQGAARGADILHSDIEKEAYKIAGDKQPPEVIRELEKLFSRLRGNKLDLTQEGLKPGMTTQDILAWRKQLDSELPKTFWDQLSTKNPAANKAIGIMRTALSNTLHESAPGTVTPDKFLGGMAKIGGDLPSLLKKMGITFAVDRASKAVGGPQVETGADILTLLKLLGKI